MQRILDLIEQTLDADVTSAELSEASGYSHWHFLRMFQQAVGMPLMRYRTRRRLAHALWQIANGVRITDAALRWGFDTYSGFYRAFQLEYGCSPKAYLKEHRVCEPAVPQLKEETYRMLTREKFREALECWGLDLPLSPIVYPSGHMSDTAMYAGEELVLKAYADHRSCQLAMAMADALMQRGIPAGCALPLPDGQKTLSVCNLWITLCRRVPGVAMRADCLLERPEENGFRIGEALAKLHQAAAALDDLPCIDDQDFAAHLIDWALPNAQGALPEGFSEDFADRAAQLRGLPRAIVHRDPNPGNMVDTPDGVGFTDFDLTERSVRLFDPCYTATAVLSETFGRDDLPWETAWPVFAKAVLAGYDRVSSLTDAEWAAVPTMMTGNELLCLAAFAGSSKYRDVFETNKRMLTWLLGHMPV